MSARVLGDYNVIKQIGQGSLGTVFLAEHRFMKRQYVLKMLPEELASDRSFIQRFEEEVKTLSALDHPNIVKIHNVSFSHGAYFLVTDCIVDAIGETTNLAQYMAERGKRLPEEELLRLLRQLASALDYAHKRQQGRGSIAHRGIKLNNVLVGKGKGGADFFLSDFGLSRIIGAGAVLSRTYKVLADALGVMPAVSAQGKIGQERYSPSPGDTSKLSMLNSSFLQNFAFLSPEQKRIEDSHQVDSKADVYAFGILTYYLITGEFPEGVFDSIHLYAPEYQLDWDAFICQCMQSNPLKRPQSIEEALNRVCVLGKSLSGIPQDKAEDPNGGQDGPFRSSFCRLQYSGVETSSLIEGGSRKEESVNTFSEMEQVKQNVEAEEASMPADLPVEARVPDEPEIPQLAPLDLVGIKQLQSFSVGEKIQERMRSEFTVTHYRPEVAESKQVEPILTDMYTVKGGEFSRGSNNGSRDEAPRHSVFLKSYAIDIHPVTNEQFLRFLEFVGGEKDSQNHDIIRLRETRIKRTSGKLTIESGYAKHPVIGVTWYGALAYAKWVHKRLPTEAEWEVAACGGFEGAIYPTGEEIEKSQANFFSSDTTAVMSYAPNAYGLYDLSGNVYEWCQDWYDYTYYEHSAQEPDNPQGPLQGVYRVLRGGCWKSLKDDLRCAHRHRNNPGTINRTYGFRCAADIDDPAL